jgi:polyketide synthase 13
MTITEPSPTVEAIMAWLTRTVAEYAERPEADISPDTPLIDYGLVSVSAFAVMSEVEDAFGVLPDVTAVWDHPTVRSLAAYLLELVELERQ